MKIIQISAEETYPLRLAVLKTGDAYKYQYKGDLDKNTIHLAAIQKNEIIGIVSLMKTDNATLTKKQLQIRGMAIAKKWQNKNIGQQLIAHVKMTQKSMVIWCNAREKSVGFYQKQGFQTEGDPFEIENVGVHYRMLYV